MLWLVYLNRSLGVLTGLLVILAVGMTVSRSHSEWDTVRMASLDTLPDSPFVQPRRAYAAIGSGPLLALAYEVPKAELPDLRRELVLHGLDERPDADPDHPFVHVSVRDTQQMQVLAADRLVYLLFDRNSGSYLLSPKNAPTNLWMILSRRESDVHATVSMIDAKGNTVRTPEAHAQFVLSTAPGARPVRTSWQLGAHRVDNSLLARMHTRWYGQDLFLADHGGEKLAHTNGKERLDFGQGDDLYSCFVGTGECLVFKGDRWHNLQPGESSRGLPLLSVKAIKEKLMLFELWDEMGCGRITLSVMRARDVALPRHLCDTIRFVGARTWSEYVLSLGEERVMVSPQEWLLVNEEGWQVLRTVDAIDAYVSGRMKGELLVLEGLAREGGTQVLKAHLYNTSRTSMEPLNIPMTPQMAQHPAHPALSREPTCQHVQEQSDLSLEQQLLSLPTVIRGLTDQLKEETP